MRRPCLICVLLHLLSASSARASRSEPNSGPFEIRLEAGLEISVTGMLMLTIPEFLDPAWARRGGSPLNPASLNPFDRAVIGNRSHSASLVSDGLLAAGLTLPLIAHFVDQLVNRPADGWSGFGRDALVLAETFAVTSMVTNLVKFAVLRPRPYAYDPAASAEERGKAGASLSFFSGHTALAFSMATAYSYLFHLRHPGSRWRLPVWIISHALAASTAVLRVMAGKHFWTDVTIGAAVGSSIGWLVPRLHRPMPRLARWLPDLRVAPYFPEGGAGVMVGFTW